MDLLGKLLGTWTPPAWPAGLRQSWSKTDPADLRRALKGLGAILALALLTHQWSRQLPEKEALEFQLLTPGPTKLEKGAKPDPLSVRFSGSAAKLAQIGKAPAGIRLTPSTPGQWLWTSDRELVFTPERDWAVGEAYLLSLPASLFPPRARLKSLSQRFNSAPLTARVVSSEFNVDLKDPKLKTVAATLAFSHPVDGPDLEKRLSLRFEGKKRGFWSGPPIPLSVTYDEFRGQAYVRSASLPVQEEDTFLSLEIAGARSARGGKDFETTLETRIRVPGSANYFRIANAELTLARDERDEPVQVLVIETTAGCRDEDLQKALSLRSTSSLTQIPLTAVPADRDWPTTHSFRLKTEAQRQVVLEISKGVEGLGGYSLSKGYSSLLRTPAYPQELRILHDGALLQLSGEKKLSLLSRSLPGLRFELGRVLPDRLNHLITQTSGDLKRPSFENYHFNEDDITERFSEERPLKTTEDGKAQYTAFDFNGYLSPAGAGPRRGVFFLKAQAWDPARKRTLGLEDSRLILITDLGLVVKEAADGSRDVFAQSLADGRPAGGVRVEVLGRNGLMIASALTGESGRASLPPLGGFKREKQPTVITARLGADLSFLPYDRADRRLDLSRFDVGGLTGAGSGEKLDAYLFSDRGLYRPGEAFHLGLIVKGQRWMEGLAGLPLELVIADPRGMEVLKRRLALPDGGFDEFTWAPEENAPTGLWQASLYVVRDARRGALLGSTPLRVEEFLPDRLKIEVTLSKPAGPGWVSPDDLRGRVSLRNLFGTPAQERRVTATLSLSPAVPSFAGFPGFVFQDPLQAKKSFQERLQDVRTDEKGEAELSLDLGRFDRFTYRLSLLAEGFEAEGGRGVASQASVLVSPLEALVGWKADGELSYLHRASTHAVSFIAIGPDLKSRALPGLTLKLIERRFVSSLVKQRDGIYRYQSLERELERGSRGFSLAEKGTSVPLDTSAPGDFRLKVFDVQGTELARVAYTVVGAANLTRSLEKDAELQVRLSKADYAAGEELELELRAPYVGAGLITIERDKVYAHHWFKTSTTHSTQRIRLPEGLEGNAYAVVTFLRDAGSPEIFMSPLSYGAAPFSISRARRTLPLELSVPGTVRPGERLRLRARTARPSRLVVFAVDEGILQVARYQAPDPLGHLLRKRALEVRTSQILDLLLPEFRLVLGLSAPGGDADGFEAVGKNLNPFKRRRDRPAVFWSGILASSGAWTETSFDVPDSFNGSLRVFAVAVGGGLIGSVQDKLLVRGDFVLSPNVPAFAAPGDEFDVSVGLSNGAVGSGPQARIALEVTSGAELTIVGQRRIELTVPEGRETSASFRVRVSSTLGSARLQWKATSGNWYAKSGVELSVRPAVPYEVTAVGGTVKRGRAEVASGRKLLPEYRKQEATASPLPLALAKGMLTYLEAYPYGCTEQLVSKAFPAVVLRGRPEFGFAPKDVEQRVARVLSMLRSRQRADGSFGYWDAGSQVSDLVTAYALHFLLEAKDRGYAVPPDMLDKGLAYLRGTSEGAGGDLAQARLRAYALYLLTRSGERTTAALAALRERLAAAKTPGWREDLTGSYLAASYKLLRLDADAETLISAGRLGRATEPDASRFHDQLMSDSQKLHLVSRHFAGRLTSLPQDRIRSVVGPILEGRYTTISSAFAILALDAYADAAGVLPAQDLALSEVLEGGAIRPLALSRGLFATAPVSGRMKTLRVMNKTDLFVYYQLTSAGFDSSLPAKERFEGLEVQREFRDQQGNVVTKAALGTEIEVHLKVRALGAPERRHIAVVDLLPGGFEPVIESVTRGEGAVWPQNVDVREDRVLAFGSVSSSVTDFVYRIKAVNAGRYTVPPAFGESMYDRSIVARGVPATIEVVQP